MPILDYLEDRIALSSVTVGAGDTPGLIAAINQASNGDTITLTNSTYTVTQNNTTNGANALPVITATGLTINGYGATISGNFAARLFNLGSGAGVTLENLTLKGGTAFGANAQGGAIYDAGNNLTLKTVTITNNGASASGQTANGAGNSAQGGGIYVSGGTVHLSNCIITNNSVAAAPGAAGAAGGNAQGGGIYATGATLSISGGSVNYQTVKAGAGGTGSTGGSAEGGGVFASNTALTITGGAGIIFNKIWGGVGGTGSAGGQGGAGGDGLGGGVYIANTNTSATISGGAAIDTNAVHGGMGGTGGSGAAGGAGGAAEGGGIYALAAPLTLTSGTLNPTAFSPGVNINALYGGNGGAGGGVGGAGGAAQGGGIFASGNNLAIDLGDAGDAASVSLNTAWAGSGGSVPGTQGVGGNGGLVTGGGVTVYGDKLSLTNATIYGDTAGGEGGNAGHGGVTANGDAVNYGNGGNAQGGGLFVSGSSSVTVLNSTLADEYVLGGGGAAVSAIAKTRYGVGGTAQGGGMYATSSTVSVLNSTFANTLVIAGTGSAPSVPSSWPNGGTTAQGSGIYATGGTLTLTNNTIAWNYLVTYTDLNAVQGQGAGVYNASSNTLHLENTIIALNQLFTNHAYGEESGSPYDLASDLYGNAASSDRDLIGDGSGSNLSNGTNGDQVGSDAAPLNPIFAPAIYYKDMYTKDPQGNEIILQSQIPANYGGLTYTLPLAANSPALNAGDPSAATAIASAEGVSTATDQRGMARVINNEIDIGATQSGLLLAGTAPATVQAGQDITYTFTLSNNGPTSLSNVTLTDSLPANTTFVSFSAPSGWTTSTPAAGATGTVTANIGTLAANTTATFTLVVQVSSSAQGSTITNNANVTYTGTANPVSSNLTLSTTVPGSSQTDITNQVAMFSTPIVRDPFAGPGTYIQAALFINTSGAAINGPIALVLNNLPAGVTVTNANGTTNGSPYINIEPPGGTWQPGVRYFLTAVIVFSDPTHVKITYTPEVVQGI